MASFVLVHGSGQNADSWSRVATALTARGHVVATPDLCKRPARSLRQHAVQIAAAARAPRTIFVAHSLSGVFLPLLPALHDTAMLVFVAAVIPEPRRSVREQFAADATMFSPAWIASAPRWFDPAQARAIGTEFLFHDCDDDTLAWALTTQDPLEPSIMVQEPAPFDAWPNVPTACLIATADRTLTPSWCERACHARLRCEPLHLQSGHCPHVSRASDVTRWLHELLAHATG